MEDHHRDRRLQEYQSKQSVQSDDKITDFEAYLLGKDYSKPYESKDEFFSYGRAIPKETPILKAFNPIEW